MAVAGLVLGIVGIVFTFIPGINLIGIIAAIIGIILSAIAMKQQPEKKGMAVAGLVLSIIALVIWVIAVLIVGMLFAGVATSLMS